MTIQHTEQLNKLEKESIFKIWNKVYPKQLTYTSIHDFENYLEQLSLPIHYLAKEEKQLIGWLCVFNRDNERWLVLLIDSKFQGKGIGRTLLNQAKENEAILNGWVVDHNYDLKNDGSPYLSPLSFYIKNGFQLLNERMNKNGLSTIKIRWQG